MTMRTLNSAERRLIDKLMAANFPGKCELIAQLETAMVDPIDQNGSLRMVIGSSPTEPVVRRIPIEAQGRDDDGICIHALCMSSTGSCQNWKSTKMIPHLLLGRPV